MSGDPRERGQSLAGYVVGLAIVALGLGTAAGALAPAARARDVEAATRRIETALRAAGWRALAMSRDEGFAVDEARSRLVHVRDATGNGVRASEIESGVEEVLGVLSIPGEHPRARLGPVPWPGVPVPPSGPGLLDPSGSGVRFGSDSIIRLTADGHAQPGSLLVTDGEDALCAVVVSGAGARVRSFCYERKEAEWRRR